MSQLSQSVRVHELAGLTVVCLLTFFSIGWASNTSISGAIIAKGFITSSNEKNEIKHMDGGLIEKIYVNEGQWVKAKAPLVKLDDQVSKAKLKIIESQLIELIAEQSRLESERDNKVIVKVIEPTFEFISDKLAKQAFIGQQNFLNSIRKTIETQKKQLNEQVSQIMQSVQGMETRLASINKQKALTEKELEIIAELKERGLARRDRFLLQQKEFTKLEGQAGEIISEITRLKEKASEIKYKLIEITERRLSEVITRLVEVRNRISGLREQRLVELTRLKRTEIIAPVTGYIHQLSVHTETGIISPGEKLMMIVPETERMIVRVQVRPQDIDNISEGQIVRVRLSALNRDEISELNGIVSVIGADQLKDPATNFAYFQIDIALDPSDIKQLERSDVKLGLPVEAFIITDDRTVLSYLLQPVKDHFIQSFRD